MKRILVHGYFRDNLGDDLFFRVLAMRYPDALFYLPTTRLGYRNKYADIPNVRIVDFMGISRFTSHKVYTLPKLYSIINMKRFDAVVCIGGSLFIDIKDPLPSHRIETEKYSFISDWEYAKKSGIPYYVLGVNWGPCYNTYFREYFNKVFDSLEDLYFRDQRSYLEFSDKPSARYGGDILLDNSLLRSSMQRTSPKKQICISPINPSAKNENPCDSSMYYDKLAQFCQDYMSNGYTVILLSFCKDEGDDEACTQILARANHSSQIKVIRYLHNWQEILQSIQESQFIIASRFHATVIGWTLRVPVYSLVYSNKTVELIHDCGYKSGYTRIENIHELNSTFVKESAILPLDHQISSGADVAFTRLDALLK